MSHYNENDLKTVWYAYKGGMKKYQVAQLMGITEVEAISMLNDAQKLWGKGPYKTNEIERAASNKAPYMRKEAKVHEDKRVTIERPKAKYDNKSSEERINELLSLDV